MRHYTQLVRAAVTALLMLAAVAGVAVAGPLEDAKEAYDRGDFPTALRLFRSLADQGNAVAQQRVGLMYESGQSVQRNYAEAVKWYRRASDQGSQVCSGFSHQCYEVGSGVPQDYVQAYMWCNLSAAQGFQLAKYRRAELEKLMTPGQIAEAQKLAREWNRSRSGNCPEHQQRDDVGGDATRFLTRQPQLMSARRLGSSS